MTDRTLCAYISTCSTTGPTLLLLPRKLDETAASTTSFRGWQCVVRMLLMQRSTFLSLMPKMGVILIDLWIDRTRRRGVVRVERTSNVGSGLHDESQETLLQDEEIDGGPWRSPAAPPTSESLADRESEHHNMPRYRPTRHLSPAVLLNRLAAVPWLHFFAAAIELLSSYRAFPWMTLIWLPRNRLGLFCTPSQNTKASDKPHATMVKCKFAVLCSGQALVCVFRTANCELTETHIIESITVANAQAPSRTTKTRLLQHGISFGTSHEVGFRPWTVEHHPPRRLSYRRGRWCCPFRPKTMLVEFEAAGQWVRNFPL